MNRDQKIEIIQRSIGFNFDKTFQELMDEFGLDDKEVETWFLISCLYDAAIEDSSGINQEDKEEVLSLAQEVASDIESSAFLGDMELSPVEDFIENLGVEEKYLNYLQRILDCARKLISERKGM